MKMKGLNCLVYACLMFGWAGCSSEADSFPYPEEQEVVFQIVQGGNPMTKANIAGFEIGDSIGIYAVKRTDPAVVAIPGVSGNQAHNAKWIKTEEGWQPASLADKIVFPQDGAKLDFYAYYPYDAMARNPEAIRLAVKTDQTTEDARKVSDFMISRNTTGINEGIVALTFSHVLSMVEVEVKAGNVVSPEAGLQVQIAEISGVTVLNLGNQVLTPESRTETIVLGRQENEDDQSTYTYRGYVPAQDVPAGIALFRCVMGGKVYIYNCSNVSLVQGIRTPFELTLKAETE